jgi:glyoxylase-like metal-dependent hydrolase (beta-lactamase superfamily II)
MERTLFGRPARFAGGLREVAPRTFAWLQPNGELGESNAGLVVGDDEALLVDTLWDLALTRRMLAAVRARLDVPVRTLVNTHSDPDHTWGNQVVVPAEIVATRAAADVIRHEAPGPLRRMQSLAGPLARVGALPLPVVGSLRLPLLPRLPLRPLARYLGAGLAPYDFSGIAVTPPTREFSGELELDAGGREVRLIEVGPAHTPGDLIVHVPDVRVCFAADILFIGVTPVMWAGPVDNWIAALDRIAGLEVDVVVPGHGPVGGREDVAVLRRYLEWVRDDGGRRLSDGLPPPAAAREMLRSPEARGAPWSGWDSPERLVITLATMNRARAGGSGPPGMRERLALFAAAAALADDLDG